ncbi:MAG TPA: hypothetical protein VHF27_00535 [Acidimicrobiales bacterium]|nr:hypothetical protein [Acidimicrobiales bacterium]
MLDSRTVQLAATAWAMVGFAIALPSLARVNADARLLVGVASVVFPTCALLAGVAVVHGRPRAAGVLLLLSAATPTYFVSPVNLVALAAGAALLLARR